MSQTKAKGIDVAAIRRDFPMLQTEMQGHPLLYLDTAATALTPQSVIDATTAYYSGHYGTVHRAVYSLAADNTARCDDVRAKVAHFLGAASPEEIIFTKGCTESINLVAYCLARSSLNRGDEILVSEIEHHANIVPWQLACQWRGAELKEIPVDDNGDLLLSEFEKLLSYKTKLVAIGHISNAIGTLHPLKQIIEMAHDVGALVLVDGAQAAPYLPVNVQELDADFYTFSGHKLYGPTGIGVLYGKKALLNDLPPYQGGGDMIEQVTFEETTYAPVPLRFEAGTPNIAGILGLGAAIDYVERLGRQNIRAHGQELVDYALKALYQIPHFHPIGTPKERGPIISFTINGAHPLDIATLLDLRGVAIRSGHHCAQPAMERFGVSATLRLSFGCYTTTGEIDRFIEELAGALAHLR
ncbi:MAG: cysteine desulfurase [Parachlamydiales bacterium]